MTSFNWLRRNSNHDYCKKKLKVTGILRNYSIPAVINNLAIRDSIETPYITNLLGKDSNRCQMTRMFFRPDMFLGYVLSFVDKASEGEASTFV